MHELGVRASASTYLVQVDIEEGIRQDMTVPSLETADDDTLLCHLAALLGFERAEAGLGLRNFDFCSFVVFGPASLLFYLKSMVNGNVVSIRSPGDLINRTSRSPNAPS